MVKDIQENGYGRSKKEKNMGLAVDRIWVQRLAGFFTSALNHLFAL